VNGGNKVSFGRRQALLMLALMIVCIGITGCMPATAVLAKSS